MLNQKPYNFENASMKMLLIIKCNENFQITISVILFFRIWVKLKKIIVPVFKHNSFLANKMIGTSPRAYGFCKY